jgi:hypothetical protein
MKPESAASHFQPMATTLRSSLRLSPTTPPTSPPAGPQSVAKPPLIGSISTATATLIKTEVTVRFARGPWIQARQLVETLEERELAAEIKQAVSHQTLTAWLREQVEEHQKLPPLDVSVRRSDVS